MYKSAVSLLTDLRASKGPYHALLRKHHLSSQRAHEILGSNLLGGVRGRRVRASKSDRLVRELLFPTGLGDVSRLVRGSKAASKLSDYYNDRDKLLRGKLGVADFEAKWRGVRIAGKAVFADARAILEMADADVLKMDNLYASVDGER